MACKVGQIPKTEVGIPAECEAVGVTMCNPILQARKLNEAGTELNVVVGLCVGHDSLFYKYAEAPTTTLVTKDRVLGHNPVAALYTAKTYYSKLLDKSAHNETCDFYAHMALMNEQRFVWYFCRYSENIAQRFPYIKKGNLCARHTSPKCCSSYADTQT